MPVQVGLPSNAPIGSGGRVNMGKKENVSAAELAKIIGFHEPTEEQAQIAEHPPYVNVGSSRAASPLLVVAGAGSGKTKTLSLRAAYLATEHGIEGQNILGLTFTRKAAAELAENLTDGLNRVEEARKMARGGEVEPFAFLLNSPEATTYNSFALNVVQEFGATVGITPSVEHMGEAASWQLMSEVVAGWSKDLHGELKEGTVVARALSLREDVANQGMSAEEARRAIERLTERFESLRQDNIKKFTKPFQEALETLHLRLDLLEIIDEFEKRKAATGRMDYADQVNAAIKIVEENEEAREVLRDRHKIVFLDEFQDTSVSQMKFLSTLFRDHPVTAVGDPNQAIYGWRGASAGALEDFHQEFTVKGVEPTTLKLSTAWRNSKKVLGVANTIADPLNPESGAEGFLRPRKGAPDGEVVAKYAMTEQDSIDGIVSYIAGLREQAEKSGRGKPLEVAVLARANSPLLPIVEALRARQIPAQLAGGDSLLQHPAVVDLRAALEITWDVGQSASLTRLLTNLDLSPSDMMALGMESRRIARKAVPEGQVPQILLEAVEAVREGRQVLGLSEEGGARIRYLGDQLATLRKGAANSLVVQVENARDTLHLERDGKATPDGENITDVLDLFAGVVASYEAGADRPTMGGFLSWLDAAEEREQGIRVPSVEIDPNIVQVLTVHSSKGLEWDVVVVADLVASRFPSSSGRGVSMAGGEPKPPVSPAPSKGWWSDPGVLPYPCRRDRSHLPDPDIWDADTPGTSRYNLFREEVGKYQQDEERRLAYVAFTRARNHLLLTGSWFSTAKLPRFPSIFFEEAINTDDGKAVETEKVELPPKEEWDEQREALKKVSFPREPGQLRKQNHQAAARVLDEKALLLKRSEKRRREDGLAAIRAGSGAAQASDQLGVQIAEQVETLLRQRDHQQKYSKPTEELSADEVFAAAAGSRILSVTEIADFVSDPEKGAADLLRPVPERPVADAVLGQAFHYWAEHYLARVSASAAELDPKDMPLSATLTQEDAAQLEALASVFRSGVVPAGWKAVGVEVPFLVQTDDYPVRGRVDALFEDQDGVTHLVDWKTRRAEVTRVSPKTAAYYQKQLELYKRAWAKDHSRTVDARIVFVSPEGAQTLQYEELEEAVKKGEGVTLRR